MASLAAKHPIRAGLRQSVEEGAIDDVRPIIVMALITSRRRVAYNGALPFRTAALSRCAIVDHGMASHGTVTSSVCATS